MSDLALPTSVVFRCRRCARDVICAARPPTQCPGCRSIGTCFVAVPASEVRPIVDAPAKRKARPSASWGLPSFAPSPSMPEPRARPVPMAASDIEAVEPDRHLTGIAPFDRALGYAWAVGGALGCAVSISGPPGTGKTTLCTQALDGHARDGLRCTLVTGEQQPEAIVRRMRQMGFGRASLDAIQVVWCDDFDQAIDLLDETDADAFMVDSLQMMRSVHATGRRRAPAQIDYGSLLFAQCCHAEGRFAGGKQRIGYLINHADDEGDMAGPEAARHNVDALVLLEHFDPHTGEALPPKRRKGFVRLLVEKNRFGDATGCTADDERGVEQRLELRWKKPDGRLIALGPVG